MAKTVRSQLVAELPDLLGEDELLSISVGFDLEPIVVARHRLRTPETTLEKWAKELGSPEGSVLRVWRRAKNGTFAHTDLGAELVHPCVQPLADGGWLAVASRAVEPEHNAVVFDANGASTSDFHAGDAIQDVQVTGDGRVWVSNFDEKDSEKSELAEGLICLDLVGRPVFRFSSVLSDAVPGVFDCYALNVVSGSETWACYYDDFPLVQIRDFEVVGIWKDHGVSGADAFAVHDHAVLFGPGYEGQEALALVTLGRKRSRKLWLADATGKRIAPSEGSGLWRVTHFARGPRMFAFDGRRLFMVDMREMD